MRIKVAILLLHLYLAAACHHSGPKSSMQTFKKYTEGFIESGTVKLHYIDWGGEGGVLVLLSGLGDTPFLFGYLAEQLSQHFHVISYARRGHEKSVATDGKYDNATLVADLKFFLDSLHIDKASLLGWSMGGNEITELASLYPDRVNKLIYFEAGYDLSDGGFDRIISNTPKAYLADSTTLQSLDRYREWYHKFWFGDVEWNEALEANLLASVKVDANGYVNTIPADDVFRSTLKEAMQYRRTYEKVASPSLVIYTAPFFHPADNTPATIKSYDSIEENIVIPWRSANRKRIEAELRNAVIVDAPKGTHTSFLFLSNDFLAETIRTFLDK